LETGDFPVKRKAHFSLATTLSESTEEERKEGEKEGEEEEEREGEIRGEEEEEEEEEERDFSSTLRRFSFSLLEFDGAEREEERSGTTEKKSVIFRLTGVAEEEEEANKEGEQEEEEEEEEERKGEGEEEEENFLPFLTFDLEREKEAEEKREEEQGKTERLTTFFWNFSSSSSNVKSISVEAETREDKE